MDQATVHGDEVIATPFGPIELQDSFFDQNASTRLLDEMDYQRASQAYIWSIPLVGFAAWRDNQTKSFGVSGPTDFVVLKSLKEKRGIVTANLTTPYIFNFSNLSKGALRIEYPPGQTAGAVLDAWQRPVFDLGLIGPDQGKGATYVLVGPGEDPIKYQKRGVHVLQSATNNVMIGLRILDTNPAYFDTFSASFKMGPANGKVATSKFIADKDVEWSGTPPRGLDYWTMLASILSEEPVRQIDKAWMAMLEPLGIAKGKTFAPDARPARRLWSWAS